MNDTTHTPMQSTLLDLLRLARDEELALVASLSDTERAAEGTAEHWSAKDTIAHIAAWKQRHAVKLAAAARGETPPTWTDDALISRLNAETYAAYRGRSWQDVQAVAEGSYAALLAQIQRLSEDELTSTRRSPALHGEAQWPETLGNGAWHPFTHLIELAQMRGDAAAQARLREARTRGQEMVLEALERMGMPPRERTEAIYNLACLYALSGRHAAAVERLREALNLRPDLTLHAKHDDDFATLRSEPAFQALIAGAREAEVIDREDVLRRQGEAAPPIVVDVRGPDEYAAGHIAGAMNIPLDQLQDRLAELPPNRLVVTYCNMFHRGMSRCERAASLLEQSGVPARALDGGYPGWQQAGLPVAEP
jgi:rhodanese-related sulfurtransferase